MLAALLNPPESQADWDRWGFDHLDSHDRIRAAIAARGGPNLTPYQIYPILEINLRGFLERNNQLHIEMNGALQQKSDDLQDVNFKDASQKRAWIFLHYQEHQSAEQELKL